MRRARTMRHRAPATRFATGAGSRSTPRARGKFQGELRHLNRGSLFIGGPKVNLPRVDHRGYRPDTSLTDQTGDIPDTLVVQSEDMPDRWLHALEGDGRDEGASEVRAGVGASSG